MRSQDYEGLLNLALLESSINCKFHFCCNIECFSFLDKLHGQIFERENVVQQTRGRNPHCARDIGIYSWRKEEGYVRTKGANVSHIISVCRPVIAHNKSRQTSPTNPNIVSKRNSKTNEPVCVPGCNHS